MLSIIIVNYNVKEFLQNLLKSIEKTCGNITKEIIVVDNASDDGSVEILREKYPYVRLIANKENLGFGAANNLGMSVSKGRFLLLINPDTIVQEDTFSTLLEFFSGHPEAGMAGCKVLNSDGTLQLACRRGFPGPWTSFCKVSGLSTLFPKSRLFARYNLTFMDENQTYEVDAISGAFMMMRREVFEKTQGFDQRFFMYGEDLDLCYRVQQAGYKVYYVHTTQIIHYKGESTKRSSMDETRVFYDAMNLFVQKHFSSSFIVSMMLQAAIFLRKTLAFMNLYRLVLMAVVLDFIFFDISIFLADKIYSFYGWHGFPARFLPIVYTLPALFQILISSITGVYKKESLSVLRNLYSLLPGFLFISSATFFFKHYAYSRAIVILIYMAAVFMLPLWRILLKVFFKIGIREDLYKSRTLIVGTDDYSAELARKLKSRLTSLHHIAGFISSSRVELGRRIEGIEVIGSMDNIRKIIKERKVNEVIFSSAQMNYQQMLSVVSQCQNENVDFKVAGSGLDFLVGKSSVTMLEDIPLLDVSYNISTITSRVTKRLLDVFISLPLLIFIYPFVYFFSVLKKGISPVSAFILSLPGVAAGRLSLVGPKSTEEQPALYLGKKGLTGLWFTETQGIPDSDELRKLDVFYARNQNIWLDMEILGKTIARFFKFE